MNRGMLSPFSMIQAVTLCAPIGWTRYGASDLELLAIVRLFSQRRIVNENGSDIGFQPLPIAVCTRARKNTALNLPTGCEDDNK